MNQTEREALAKIRADHEAALREMGPLSPDSAEWKDLVMLLSLRARREAKAAGTHPGETFGRLIDEAGLSRTDVAAHLQRAVLR